jgi:hypothetical protein
MGAVLAHAFFEGLVGGIGVPAAIDEDDVAAIFEQVREDVGEALGDAGMFLELAAEGFGVLDGELGEGGEELVDAVDDAHGAVRWVLAARRVGGEVILRR